MTAPSWFDWITVAAIVAGPVLALATQRGLDAVREKRQQRVQIYLTLMSLRSTPLHTDHVKALNVLDTVFSRRNDKDRRVRDTWDKVLAQLNTKREGNEDELKYWDNRLLDLRVDLYQAVGRAVGYDHSVEYIKTHIYGPKYYHDAEMDQISIREGFVKILSPNGLKVVVNNTEPDVPPSSNEPHPPKKPRSN